jgi:hypothetical protein
MWILPTSARRPTKGGNDALSSRVRERSCVERTNLATTARAGTAGMIRFPMRWSQKIWAPSDPREPGIPLCSRACRPDRGPSSGP